MEGGDSKGKHRHLSYRYSAHTISLSQTVVLASVLVAALAAFVLGAYFGQRKQADKVAGDI